MAIKKRRSFFMIMRIIGLFFMGLIVALFIALSQVNLETLRGNVLTVLRDATGLPVEIEGAVSWKFSLRPRIELNQVRVLNASWAKEKYAFSADRIDVRLNLLSLFQDRPTIQNVRIHDAVVNIEKNSDGKYSIEPFASSGEEPSEITDVTDVFVQPDYPFEDPGLGGIQVRNLVANIVGDTYKVVGFSVRYVPKADEREYAGWIKSDQDVFPFIVSYSKYNSERKIYPVRIALATGGDALIANIALEGTSRAPIDFKIKGDIPDIASFGRLFNLDLAYMPAISVNLAGGVDRKKLTLRKSSLSVRGTNLNISGAMDWSGRKPSYKVEIESKSINLMELFPELYAGNKQLHLNRELNAFKDIPLYGKDMLGRAISVRLIADNFIVYRDLNIRDLDVSAKLKDNHIRIDGAAVFAGGNIRVGADGDIDNNGRIFMQAGAAGRNISVGSLLHQLRFDNLISDLPVNIEAYARANGRNLSEVMQTITGPVQLYSIGAGYAHSELVSYMYGADFLTNLRHSIQDLFRSDKKYNQMNISCVAVNTKLRDGLAETRQGVAVETNAIDIRLAGDVNLGNETMHLALTTVPVRGIKLSLTGNVVNSIEITGNLSEPDIRISGAAVAGKVASATGIGLLLAPFTGGIGLVAGAGVGLLAGDLLENWLADDEPCKTALQRGAPAQRGDPDWLNAPLTELLNGVLNNNQ
ncbi:MAG: AsmA family protein [Alphaproteobacteria bacterium]|nr:AsmA family protein [Alphaproteobacteria bacterium]